MFELEGIGQHLLLEDHQKADELLKELKKVDVFSKLAVEINSCKVDLDEKIDDGGACQN